MSFPGEGRLISATQLQRDCGSVYDILGSMERVVILALFVSSSSIN